ncbi:MAG TPA: hypothetical protein VL403_14635, partial [Candidatus Kryptonia bacterium]|nr:hypothetical protein [Candidatus Kryptonia bacterium]
GRVDAQRVFGTMPDGGGAFENVFIRVIVTAGDRISHYEIFDVGDVDQALARFAELRLDPLRIPPNAASRVRDRVNDAFMAEDWTTQRSLARDDLVFDDRRKLAMLSGGVDLWIQSARLIHTASGVAFNDELIGALGDRIELRRRVVTGTGPDGDAFESEFIVLTEIDADGLLTASINLDVEDRRAAFDEAQTRFVTGEAAGCRAQTVINEFGRAIARHDWDGLAAYFVDGLVYRDRRRLSFGEIPCEKLIESLHVLSDLGPDVGGEMLRVLAWNNYGRVAVIRQFGTTREGGAFESVFVPVLVVRDDRIVAYEIFDLNDTDQALARFAELCSDLRPANRGKQSDG